MKTAIKILKTETPLTEEELTQREKDGAVLIAINTIVDKEYGEGWSPGMPSMRVRRWVYHFREEERF